MNAHGAVFRRNIQNLNVMANNQIAGDFARGAGENWVAFRQATWPRPLLAPEFARSDAGNHDEQRT